MHNRICVLLFLGLVSCIPEKKPTPSSIIDEPKCGEVKFLCPNLSENDDILILECLQSLDPARTSELNEDCQHAIWAHIKTLISNERVKDYLFPQCSADLSRLNCDVTIEGEYLKCIVNRREEIASNDCSMQVRRLEAVAFQDNRWLLSFLQDCDADIARLKCGRMHSISLGDQKTVTCLQNNILNITDSCKKSVFKLSELQADSLRLDRQMYASCVYDHRRLCGDLPAGSRGVFRCLAEQPQALLSDDCRAQMLRRQKLISQDYRVSPGLMRACKEDIKKTHCRRQTSTEKTIRLAQILLCLENMVKNGTTKVAHECQLEMGEHRKSLMQDFRLSPEIVDGCADEMKKFCPAFEVGGKTIHCLMEHARLKNVKNKRRIGPVCQRALEALIQETDAGEDWRVDPVLHQACYPVVKSMCPGLQGGDATIMSCLMDQIGADHMTEDCENALIQIQYFIARDFKLDPQLYRACKEDAVKMCHASRAWSVSNTNEPSFDHQVLPCLYRYAYHEDKSLQIQSKCLEQIQRVKRQRAISVDLQPDIEELCLDDLALLCFELTAPGQEMQCLQKSLDDLKDKCRAAVEQLTEAEAEHVELNPYIMQHCKREMAQLCEVEVAHDEGDVLECLISHKNHAVIKANAACRVSIEHFQIISLKDFRFSFKFKVACKHYAMRFCGKAKNKPEVVACLSERVTNDTIRGVKSDVPKECRQQLKAQLLQRRESIDLDPKLKSDCASDIKAHCSHVEPGAGQVLECLQGIREKLGAPCEEALFSVKKEEIFDNSVDFALMTMCAGSIDEFCPHHDRTNVLDCLKLNKDQRGFGKQCRQVVMHRLVEQNTDYQLNPGLQKNCKLDIRKYCKAEAEINGRHVNGAVIKCLKMWFKKAGLSPKCETEMVGILREQALDVSLNPLLRVLCKDELDTICKSGEEEDGYGKAEECLKNALMDNKIPTAHCAVEVANMIEESQADIQVDPLLQQACALDLLHFCRNVPQGNSRHIKCLRLTMDTDPQHLSMECKNMLAKRLKMYENAAQVAPPPADFNELYHQVVASPARQYFFLTTFIMFGVIFAIGIIFGKAFKRHISVKNK